MVVDHKSQASEGVALNTLLPNSVQTMLIFGIATVQGGGAMVRSAF
jgi:hypothetical protein